MPWHTFEQFGLLGLVIGAVIFLLFLVIKWTLSTTKDILKQAAQEREAWIKAFGDHTEQARLFHESVKDAHNYQREEHRQFSINQNESSKAMAMICQSLGQVEQALGRINGYKD